MSTRWRAWRASPCSRHGLARQDWRMIVTGLSSETRMACSSPNAKTPSEISILISVWNLSLEIQIGLELWNRLYSSSPNVHKSCDLSYGNQCVDCRLGYWIIWSENCKEVSKTVNVRSYLDPIMPMMCIGSNGSSTTNFSMAHMAVLLDWSQL